MDEKRKEFYRLWMFRICKLMMFAIIMYFAIGLHLSLMTASTVGICAMLGGLIGHVIVLLSWLELPKEQTPHIEHKHVHFHIHQNTYQRGHYVYVIRDIDVTGFYKIGRTNDPYVRLSAFEVKLPFQIEIVTVLSCNNAMLMEKQLHDRYALKRVRGEWFQLSDEDVQSIKQLGQGQPK